MRLKKILLMILATAAVLLLAAEGADWWSTLVMKLGCLVSGGTLAYLWHAWQMGRDPWIARFCDSD